MFVPKVGLLYIPSVYFTWVWVDRGRPWQRSRLSILLSVAGQYTHTHIHTYVCIYIYVYLSVCMFAIHHMCSYPVKISVVNIVKYSIFSNKFLPWTFQVTATSVRVSRQCRCRAQRGMWYLEYEGIVEGWGGRVMQPLGMGTGNREAGWNVTTCW